MSLKSWVLKSPFYDFLGKRSFGQSGEDIIVWGELGDIKKGFYVDIGAYHPKQFSNSYLFYKKGWKGIVIEPNPELMRLHEAVRPTDVHLNIAIGENESVMDYIMLNDPASNTFVEKEAIESVEKAGRKILGKRPVAVLPLRKVLYQYLPKGKTVDLLSVDTEGMDLQVLQSNDWDKYQPRLIICEDMQFDFKNWKKSKVANFLDSKGYELLAKTPYSLIFRKIDNGKK